MAVGPEQEIQLGDGIQLGHLEPQNPDAPRTNDTVSG